LALRRGEIRSYTSEIEVSTSVFIMVDSIRKTHQSKIEAERLIWHLEAALPETEHYDVTAGFLLRVAIESLRKRQETLKGEAAESPRAA
jgi:hypothetical protein